MAGGGTGRELDADCRRLAIPISPADAAAVRAWCAENCTGGYMIVLGRSVLFARREDAAMAAMWWRKEGR